MKYLHFPHDTTNPSQKTLAFCTNTPPFPAILIRITSPLAHTALFLAHIAPHPHVILSLQMFNSNTMMYVVMGLSRIQFFKNTFWVGFFTSISRILGYLRERLVSHFLGVGAETDALLIAIKIPSFFRRVLAEGAFSSSFVPILTDIQKRASSKQASFILTSFAFLALILIPLIAAFEIWADTIITFLLPKLASTPERLTYTILFSRIIFPFILFISFASIFSGILQSHLRFGMVASSPAIGNLTLVCAGFYYVPHAQDPQSIATHFAWVILASGIAQFLWVLWPTTKLIPKAFLSAKTQFSSPEFRRFLRNFFPGIVGIASLQINIIVDTVFVSLLGIGGASYLAYADRVIQLPVSVISASLSITLLPSLTHMVTARKKKTSDSLFTASLGVCLLLAIPASIGSCLESRFIIKMLYNYGAFSQEHIAPTATCLCMFALGLPAFLSSKILSTLFFAHKNTRTPARATIASVAICIISNTLLIGPLGHTGIALGTTISSYSHTAILLFMAHKFRLLPPRLLQNLLFVRILCANALFAVYVYFCTPFVIENGICTGRFTCTILTIVSAVIAYILLCILCGLGKYWSMVRQA